MGSRAKSSSVSERPAPAVEGAWDWSPLTRAYLAGIIDARATFTQGTPKLPVISVKMHSKLPKALYEAFGGSFGNYVDEDHGWWRLSGKDAIRFLKRVRPYLRFKRAEAKRLIARWEERHEG